jgi:phospholipid transport system substrate-binding protein
MTHPFVFSSSRRHWLAGGLVLGGWGLLAPGALLAASDALESPEALILRVAGAVFERVKSDPAIQAGNTAKVVELVDTVLMPHMNFQRMTASAVGRFWRQASPVQKERLQQEFKTLLVRTSSGALGQLKDQSLVIRPMRSRPGDTEVVVRSELRGRGEPIQFDYRMEQHPDGWKVYDVNVLGVWLVDTYRGQFAAEIQTRGLDGLIDTLAERNRSNAARP